MELHSPSSPPVSQDSLKNLVSLLLVATVFMTMCVSALALTSLDSVARIGRMSFQELFYGDSTDPATMTPIQRVLTNKYFATVITLFFGYLLTLGGYSNVWPLFGSANQLLAALVLIALAVFLKTTGRTGWTLYIPMFVMLAVTFTALIQKTIALVSNFMSGNATLLCRRTSICCCRTSYGTWCYGCIQLSEKALRQESCGLTRV